jgi:predicted XRE-type DNA-binding protein
MSSVWDAIEDTPAEAKNMELRSALMIGLRAHIEKNEWTWAEASRRLCAPYSSIVDLMHGKIDKLGLDVLMRMALRAGIRDKRGNDD